MAKTERLPPSLKQQIVPIHCRRALESQVKDLTWRRLLRDGRTHDEVEQLIGEADTTAELMSLFLFGESRSPGEVYARIEQLVPGSSSQLKFLNRAVHDAPDDLRPEALTGTIRKLLAALRELPLTA